MLRALVLLAASAAFAAPPDIASWAAAQGGSVTRDPQGRITGVNLRSTWVTDTDLEMLARVPNLQRIDLALTHITDLGLERLKPLQNVTDLNLYYAEHVTDEGLAHLRGWKRLQRLNIRGAK